MTTLSTLPPERKATKFYGKAEQAAKRILEAFESGSLPKALAPIFIHWKDDSPCRKWSWNNQLLTALAGHSDARGFRQWQAVGRCVRKGERSFSILSPLVAKRKKASEDDDETTFVYGFRATPVFGLSQTDGKALPPADTTVEDWLSNLPLLDVAKSWGLSVEAYNGDKGDSAGYYRLHKNRDKPGIGIALGVTNLSTWTHELMHAADHRLGTFTERGQHWRSETVALLGSATLLEILGHETESDRGGVWRHINLYAKDAEIEPIKACQRVLKRVCDAVALILNTAETLASEGDKA